jgi:hypothetical protein
MLGLIGLDASAAHFDCEHKVDAPLLSGYKLSQLRYALSRLSASTGLEVFLSWYAWSLACYTLMWGRPVGKALRSLREIDQERPRPLASSHSTQRQTYRRVFAAALGPMPEFHTDPGCSVAQSHER